MIQVRIASLEDVNEISYILAASWKSAYRGIVHDEYLDSINHNHWVDFLTAGIKKYRDQFQRKKIMLLR